MNCPCNFFSIKSRPPMYNNKRTNLYPTYNRNPSIHSEDLESQLTLHTKNRNWYVDNTYRMEPDEDNIFIEENVKTMIDEFLSKRIGDMVYDGEKSKQLCIELSSEIKELVKNVGFMRYKFVSHVTVSSSHRQGMRQVSRCVWNENHDRYISCVYRNATMNVVAVLYAIYFE